MRWGLMVLVVALTMAACGGVDEAGGPRLVPLTAADAGATFEVEVGDRLQIDLEGNPSTGYAWVDQTTESSTVVAVGAPEFIEQSDLVGASGIMRCAFEARATGEATIRLAYVRPWEDETEPERVFQVTVLVRD